VGGRRKGAEDKMRFGDGKRIRVRVEGAILRREVLDSAEWRENHQSKCPPSNGSRQSVV
jgi:hypothetical protein